MRGDPPVSLIVFKLETKASSERRLAARTQRPLRKKHVRARGLFLPETSPSHEWLASVLRTSVSVLAMSNRIESVPPRARYVKPLKAGQSCIDEVYVEIFFSLFPGQPQRTRLIFFVVLIGSSLVVLRNVMIAVNAAQGAQYHLLLFVFSGVLSFNALKIPLMGEGQCYALGSNRLIRLLERKVLVAQGALEPRSMIVMTHRIAEKVLCYAALSSSNCDRVCRFGFCSRRCTRSIHRHSLHCLYFECLSYLRDAVALLRSFLDPTKFRILPNVSVDITWLYRIKTFLMGLVNLGAVSSLLDGWRNVCNLISGHGFLTKENSERFRSFERRCWY